MNALALSAARNTLMLGACSTLVSTVLGTLLAFGLSSASAAVFFGGNTHETCMAALLGSGAGG